MNPTSTSPKITEGAVVVPPPENIAVLEQMGLPAKAKAIADLQMRSSSREIPDPLEHWEHPEQPQAQARGLVAFRRMRPSRGKRQRSTLTRRSRHRPRLNSVARRPRFA